MSPVTWAAMTGAIISELVGTTLLGQSQQFTKPLPTVGLVLAYALAFFLLSIALRELPVSVAYAIWSGLGVTLIAVIGWLFLKQPLDAPAIIGLTMIVGGVVIMNLFSKTVTH